MATTKKPAAKKATAKTPVKAAAAKKTTASKSAPKKAAVKKSSTKTQSGYQSFKVTTSQTPFTSLRVTRQTLYWIILVAFIIFVQLWILKLHIEVASLLEQQQVQIQNDTF